MSAPTGAAIRRIVERYGELPQQVGEWFVPPGAGTCPTVVLIHGGFWRERYERSLETKIATDLAHRGYLCWNVEYRSSTHPWPATLTDVAKAYDHIVRSELASRVDSHRIAVVGHSAGGHLVAWLASRHRLPPNAPGASITALRPALCVPQAGVVCLTLAAKQKLGSDAAPALIGGPPDEHPKRYAVADPRLLLPTGVRTVLLHSTTDDEVPLTQSQGYVDAAVAAGDDSRLVLVAGDHYAHLDAASDAGHRLREALASMTQ